VPVAVTGVVMQASGLVRETDIFHVPGVLNTTLVVWAVVPLVEFMLDTCVVPSPKVQLIEAILMAEELVSVSCNGAPLQTVELLARVIVGFALNVTGKFACCTWLPHFLVLSLTFALPIKLFHNIVGVGVLLPATTLPASGGNISHS
jgi:hypothetical protein